MFKAGQVVYFKYHGEKHPAIILFRTPQGWNGEEYSDEECAKRGWRRGWYIRLLQYGNEIVVTSQMLMEKIRVRKMKVG